MRFMHLIRLHLLKNACVADAATLQPCDRALRLSSQVISDTINALPVKPTAVSHALGPYLHVQQVGFCMYMQVGGLVVVWFAAGTF